MQRREGEAKRRREAPGKIDYDRWGPVYKTARPAPPAAGSSGPAKPPAPKLKDLGLDENDTADDPLLKDLAEDDQAWYMRLKEGAFKYGLNDRGPAE